MTTSTSQGAPPQTLYGVGTAPTIVAMFDIHACVWEQVASSKTHDARHHNCKVTHASIAFDQKGFHQVPNANGLQIAEVGFLTREEEMRHA